jgi:predicted kinase
MAKARQERKPERLSRRKSTLIIVCGLPGAGKTVHARRLEGEREGLRLCPDEWMQALGINLWEEGVRGRIEALQWELGQRLLALGGTVIIEWGTWGREEREVLRLGGRALGAAVELHYLSAPLEVLFERIQRRQLEDPPVTWEQVEGWAQIFQAPDAEEKALYDRMVVIVEQGNS